MSIRTEPCEWPLLGDCAELDLLDDVAGPDPRPIKDAVVSLAVSHLWNWTDRSTCPTPKPIVETAARMPCCRSMATSCYGFWRRMSASAWISSWMPSCALSLDIAQAQRIRRMCRVPVPTRCMRETNETKDAGFSTLEKQAIGAERCRA